MHVQGNRGCMPHEIAIIGCGTAGLAAGLYLARDGHRVTLFERFTKPAPVGAGLLLQPTGLACLAALGLDAEILAAGAHVRHLYGRTATGRTIFDISYQNLHPALFGLGIHRGALFGTLHNEAIRQNLKIITGCDVTDTRIAGDRREILNKAGAVQGVFDLVVDASGAQSTLRAGHGQMKYNRPYPYGAVWGVCLDPDQSFGQDVLQQRYDGAGVMIGALPIGKRPGDGRETLAFFWSLPVAHYGTWREAGLDVWRDKVLAYWPEMASLVAQFTNIDDLTFARYNDVMMRQWHGDHLVFIGDAAHCTSPQLGQGANLGLMDAMTLAAVLREQKNIPDALAAYAAARKSQIKFYQVASRWLTPFFQSDNQAAAWLRDMAFSTMCKTPYVRTQMMRTLGGIKTGVFTHMNPGQIHKDYDVQRRRA